MAGPSEATPTVTVTSGEPPVEVVTLTEPSYELGPIPVRPTWEPAPPSWRGFVDPLWSDATGAFGGWEMVYPVDQLMLQITNSDTSRHHLFQGDMRSAPTPITMLGLDGEEFVAPYGHAEYWVWVVRDDAGQSVIVTGTDAAVVRRYGAGLRREALEFPPPFEVALLPEGFVPVTMRSHTMEFMDGGDCCEGGYIGINLPSPIVSGPGRAVTVNGRPAELIVFDHEMVVRIAISEDTELTVRASVEVGLTAEQLLEIASGVTVTSAAVPFIQPS